jgi:hypothetical protein
VLLERNATLPLLHPKQRRGILQRVSRVSLASFFVWSLFGLAGCAAVAGLESIQESQCPFGCDGSASDDGSADSTVNTQDTGTADTRSSDTTGDHETDGASDAKGMDGTAHEVDSGHVDATDDAPPSDTDSEAGDAHDGAPPSSDAEAGTHDAGHDSGRDAGGTDSGCGPLDTVTNCGACGVACPASGDTSGVSSAMCTGSTCQYTCNAGYLDCNASVAPDTDGCECAWSGAIPAACCGGNACPSAHVTGYAMQPSGASETFYDCETSVDAQLAMDACTAYSGSAGNCAMGTCNTAGELVVCNFNMPSQDSVCWAYAGAASGYAVDVGGLLWSCPVGGATGEVKYH